MSTRSAVLAAGQALARAGGTVYTCPVGSVVLFKSYVLYAAAGVEDKVTLTAFRPSASVFAPIAIIDLLGYESAHEQVWVVLEPNDQLQVTHSSPRIDYWLSGAILPPFSA